MFFVIVVSKVSALLRTFSTIVVCFHYKLSSVWSYIFLFKWPRKEAKTKQHQNKTTFTATRSQECSPTSAKETFFGALSQGLWASLCCLLYFLAFDWLRPAVLFFINWTVCLFNKGKSYLKLSKLILNWTVRKNYTIIALLTISD